MQQRQLGLVIAGLSALLLGCDRPQPASGPVNQRDNSVASAPDNTGRNVRDRDGKTMTPMDQGNSKADIDATARIRQGVLEAKLSTSAANVKIITNGGRVTLRGPVNSEEERTRIGEIAEGVAGAGNVVNELEIKSS